MPKRSVNNRNRVNRNRTKRRKRRKRKHKTRKHRHRIRRPYILNSIIDILKNKLETDPVFKRLVLNALQTKELADSWSKRKSLKGFVMFFSDWIFSLIHPDNPGYYISEFSVLTQTKAGSKLLHNYDFYNWFERMLNARRDFLSSTYSAKNMKTLITYNPNDKAGFDMQMMPATQYHTYGPTMYGTTYQKKLMKKYKIKNKLITNGYTKTLDLPKNTMYTLFNFRSFNDFFLRRFIPGTRPLGDKPEWMKTSNNVNKKHIITSPADGKIKWLFENKMDDNNNKKFSVKSKEYTLNEVFKVCDLEIPSKCSVNLFLNKFKKGPMLDILLWFTNYHHYHSPVSGELISMQNFSGRMLSHEGPSGVLKKDENWIKKRERKHIRNKEFYWYTHLTKHRRTVYIFDTDVPGGSKVGLVMIMPIGFYGVGSMANEINVGSFITQGQEIGHFSYGGSSIIMCFEENRVNINVPYEPSSHPFPKSSSNFFPIKVKQLIGMRNYI